MPDIILAAENDELKRKLDQSNSLLSLMISISILSNEAREIHYFLNRCLELIARSNEWLLGQYWTVQEQNEVVVCEEPWYSAASLQDFRSASRERRMSKGVGLPGRVWSTGCALVIPNVQLEQGLSFTRGAVATRSGLKGAFAFPIKNGPFLTGVFEFFASEELKIDNSDKQFYEQLGSFIGTFIAEGQAKHAVREQEALYRFVLDRAYSAFVGIDRNGTVNVWNTEAERLFGWSRDEVLGMQISEFLIPKRYRDAHMQGMFRYNAGGPPKVSDKVVRTPACRKDESEIQIDMYIFPITIGATKSFGAFIASTEPVERNPDITLD